MEFQDVVARRRMIRHFAPDPIDRAVLERIARTAQRAPSAGFSQGQRLVVVTDPDVRRQVAENCSEAYYVAEGFDPWISEAPALFVPCVSEAIYRARYREPDKVAAEAAYHVLYGESSEAEDDEWPVPYWSRAELSIPPDFTPVGVIPVGRQLPDKRSGSVKRRFVEPEEFVRWERWTQM